MIQVNKNKNIIETIHNSYNDIENTQPKRLYHEKVRMFLK